MTYVLADHVEAQVLEHLKIEDHGLTVGGSVQAIGPVTLVKSTELEDELAIQQMARDSFNLALGDGAEASIAVDLVVTQSNGEVVQSR